MKDKLKPVVIGNYTPTKWGIRSTKGRIFDKNMIAPFLCDYSGGGNLVPTIIEYDYEKERNGKHKDNRLLHKTEQAEANERCCD